MSCNGIFRVASVFWFAIMLCMAANRAVSAEESIPPNLNLKIEVNEDGLYRLDYAALLAVDERISTVDPAMLALSHRGRTVALQFVGDEDALFEPGEALLFYGWQFDGSPHENQHVTHNIFQLGTSGGGRAVEPLLTAPTGTPITSVPFEVTTAPENLFSTTYTNRWDEFPNPFDSWYWHKMKKRAAEPAHFAFDVAVPYPADSGGQAEIEIELMDRKSTVHEVETRFADDTLAHGWAGRLNQNLTQTVSQSALQHGFNTVGLTITTEGNDTIYLNRITVRYLRDLVADDGELHFGYATGGIHTFGLAGFSMYPERTEESETIHFWDVTDRYAPTALKTDSHTISTAHVANARFVATQNLRSPVAISSYEPVEITPEAGAEWLAVAHSSLLTETQRLADYRAAHSRISTHVVDVQDVIEQYGHGLPIPEALQLYFKEAVETWPVAPRYLVLVGDATVNPRGLECNDASCAETWTMDDRPLVPTWLEPIDRSMGLVPHDHHYATLVGNDDVPDVAIGRIPARTAAEAATIIDKIMVYEGNLVSAETRQNHLLFLSDNIDSAGNFCGANRSRMDNWSDDLTKTHLCLDEISTDELRSRTLATLNDGVLITSYLGHGDIDGWAGGSILHTNDTAHLTNVAHPWVQISGNCLDGHYGQVGVQGIGETLLRHDGGGTAAHWGATGLGYLGEHGVLHFGFEDALLGNNVTAIGDAILYAKQLYLGYGLYRPQAYSSTLLGDPAMQLLHAELSVSQTASQPVVSPGEEFDLIIEIANTGVAATEVSGSITLPDGVVPVAVNGLLTEQSNLDFQFTTPALGMTTVLTLTARVIGWHLMGQTIHPTVTVTGAGFDANPTDNTAATTIYINSYDATAVSLKNRITVVAVFPRLLFLVVLLTTITFLCFFVRSESGLP